MVMRSLGVYMHYCGGALQYDCSLWRNIIIASLSKYLGRHTFFPDRLSILYITEDTLL